MNTQERAEIIAALYRWVNQRPGLDPRNYISHGRDDAGRAAYRSEVRSITKDLHHARALIRAVELSSITADDLKTAFKRGFSGRLSWINTKAGPSGPARMGLEYCTGQYWPTEYRRAVCAVMASALWEHKRAHCMPAPTYKHYGDADNLPMQTVAQYGLEKLSAGGWLRLSFRRQFGRAIASRFFS